MQRSVNGQLLRLEQLEVVRADLLVDRALPALEAARERGDAGPLVAACADASPRLRAAIKRREEEIRSRLGPHVAASVPEVIVGKLALARLEATTELPASEAAFEEAAWGLLRAARAAEPTSIGDWDLLRCLIDPSRRRGGGLAAIGGTLAGAAFVGRGALATPSGFALVRRRSYATGWNDPRVTARIARALARWTGPRIDRALGSLSREAAGALHGRGSPSRARVAAALDSLRQAYDAAAAAGAGVFVEIEIA